MAATANASSLASWIEGVAKSQIRDFVARVTRQGGPDFVKPAERIAVFDNDGTLWCEQPMYFQLIFAMDQVRAMAPDHSEWRDIEPFKSVLAGDMKGVEATGEKGLFQIVFATHSGMTTDQY